MIYLTNLDLNGNELRNAVIQPLVKAPENPRLGQIYCDSSSSKIKWFNGTAWKTIGVVVEASETNGNIIVDGVEMSVYKLPIATSTTLGGVKIGAGFTINAEGVLSRDLTVFTGIRQAEETDNQVFARVLSGLIPVEGDYFIIKTAISGEKFSLSAYVYDDNNWVAMDGNVDATNVIMREDIVTAGSYTQVGNVTKEKNATGSISAAGKSVADVFQAIFTKELNPTKVDPAVTISEFPVGSYEVGTVITPKWKASLSAGSYTYGPATGVVADAWSIKDSDGNTSTDVSGAFADITVGDDTEYTITAEATHGAGAIPETNLGNAYVNVQIVEGVKSKTTSPITGFRSFFYGSLTDAVELTSESIRKLTNAGKSVESVKSFDMNVIEGAVRVIIALPSNSGKVLSKVLDTVAFGTDIVSKFEKLTIQVEGINGYSAIDYDVYVYSPDVALGENIYTVTIV